MMKRSSIFIFFITIFVTLLGCDPNNTNSADGYLVRPGDIIVSDNGTSNVYQYDSNGNFKRILLSLPRSSEVVYGLAIREDTRELLVSIDGGDRIARIGLVDGQVKASSYSNINVSGTLRGVGVLNNNDMVILEGNNVERLMSDGTRVTTNFPMGNIGGTPNDVVGLSTGGFAAIHSGADRIRIYDDLGGTVGSVSGPAGSTNGYGITELTNGDIAAVWECGTDRMIIYDSNLVERVRFNMPAVMNSPRAIAQALNGNILVADVGFDQLIEIDQDGNFVRTMSLLGGASWDMVVIPEF